MTFLPMEFHVPLGTDPDLVLTKRNYLGHTRACVVHCEQQRVVPPPQPLLLIEYGKDGVNLLAGQIVANLGVSTLHRDGENSRCHTGTCRIAKGHKPEKR